MKELPPPANSKEKQRKKAGHRSWAAKGGRVAGTHVGDFMSRETRSRVMSRIRGKNTSPERAIEQQLVARGLVFERHCTDLVGRPDFVFRQAMVAVFIDGDFWHGYRFPLWSHKLAPKWQEKIGKNRARDRKNFAALRRRGWLVVRIWEHQVEAAVQPCIERIIDALQSRTPQKRRAPTKTSRLLPSRAGKPRSRGV